MDSPSFIIAHFSRNSQNDIALVHTLAELQRAHEVVTQLNKLIVSRRIHSIRRWKQYSHFRAVVDTLAMHGVTNHYEFFTMVLMWWKEKSKPSRGQIVPFNLLMADWVFDRYNRLCKDTGGNVRKRPQYDEQFAAINSSVSILRFYLDKGVPYELAVLKCLDDLHPEFLSVDPVYHGMVIDGKLSADAEVIQEWDKQRTDQSYRQILAAYRQAALDAG